MSPFIFGLSYLIVFQSTILTEWQQNACTVSVIRKFFEFNKNIEKSDKGSCVFIDKNHILTASHVLLRSRLAYVYDFNGNVYKTIGINGLDQREDIALVEIEKVTQKNIRIENDSTQRWPEFKNIKSYYNSSDINQTQKIGVRLTTSDLNRGDIKEHVLDHKTANYSFVSGKRRVIVAPMTKPGASGSGLLGQIGTQWYLLGLVTAIIQNKNLLVAIPSDTILNFVSRALSSRPQPLEKVFTYKEAIRRCQPELMRCKEVTFQRNGNSVRRSLIATSGDSDVCISIYKNKKIGDVNASIAFMNPVKNDREASISRMKVSSDIEVKVLSVQGPILEVTLESLNSSHLTVNICHNKITWSI